MGMITQVLCRSLSTASDPENPRAGGRAEEGAVHIAGGSPGLPSTGGMCGGGHPPVRLVSHQVFGLGERPDPGLPKQAAGIQQLPTQSRME